MGWWQRSETEHALHRLSDRDLADIGYCASRYSRVRLDWHRRSQRATKQITGRCHGCACLRGIPCPERMGGS
ncbi:DUF1127 domain-containing protein [Mesorhizobium sp.]|uniref:DUF1127 domain-containing protein n=1 Tax=Mesorhizobium sp. TaxID=1871066 RepID=UPI0025C02F8D|nr:DUF1127 domain-containing protein [Mesorhizobium sp.]